MVDRTGQQLGNYRLVRLLGKGGFAEVYLGEHRYLKSFAALKVLRTSLKGQEVDKFLSEAQTLVRLRHPHIVRVLEYAIDRGTPVLIMDYAPGGTLRKRHPKGSYLSLATTVAYVKQIADALQYAHNHHLIHRDVKPENMLIGPEQQVLLSDFGIALLSSTTELLDNQGMAGTIPYSAPEQLQGKPTFASDQYSLGVVVYEWLCGKRPFEGNRWDIIDQHLSVTPPPLRATFPELPAEVEAVVMRTLAKDPQERFVSVQAFARALERAVETSGVDLADDAQITAALKERPPAPFISSPDQTSQKIFLSAASADEAFVTRLKADLEQRGLLVWYSSSESTLKTLAEEDTARQGIRAARVALIVLSPHTPSSPVVKEHLRIASMYERRLVFVWAEGDDIASVLPEEWGRTTAIDLIDARQARYEQALDTITAALGEQTTAPLEPSFSSAETPIDPRNPYKGLRAFTKEDAPDFFGRDSLIQALIESMKSVLSSGGRPRLLAVLGPSGSGKSSVVMAGLLPRLQKGAFPGSTGWVYLPPMVPGKSPMESLLLTLAPFFPDKNTLRNGLADNTGRGLGLLMAQLVKQPGSKVVLMIDQFEELFTQTTTEEERRYFIHLLVTAVTDPYSPLIVILTLRADFYDRPLFYPELGRLIQNRHRVVLPMDLQDLRAVIEQPAALPDVQLTFEGNLVGDLLFETQGQAGALPLLQFTLDQLFQRREGHWLTLDAYQAIGGVKGALAKHAESTYASLPSDEHRRLARALFLRLIDPGTMEQDTTRRRAALTELLLPDPRQTAIIRETADAFIAARLLTTNEIAGIKTIEVSHEALIREWARLTEWLREAREDIALQKAVSADTAEWIRRGKPSDRLYRGTQLIEAQAWAERNLPSTNEIAFLQTSAAEHRQREAAELIRQARELALERRAVHRLRLLVAALSIFLVVAIVLASVAVGNFRQAQFLQQQAEIQAQIATSQALAAQANVALTKNHQIDKALLLSIQAYQTRPTNAARDSLLNALEFSPHLLSVLQAGSAVNQLAFRPDGQTLVSFTSDGKVTFWNMKTRKGHTLHLDFRGQITSNWAISPNDQMVAGASDHGLWLWDGRTGAKIVQLEPANPFFDPAHPDTPLAFSPDGNLLASARCTAYDAASHCTQGSLLLWHLTSQPPSKQLLAAEPALVTHLAFSPDGNTLLASSQALGSGSGHGSLQLWDVASGTTRTAHFADVKGMLENFVLSPDGKTVVASDGNNSIFLWDVASQKALPGSPITTPMVDALAFSPDGKTLASSQGILGTDKTVQLWNLSSGSTSSLPLMGHNDSITSLTFSPDGKTLASADSSGTILLWNTTARSSIAQTLGYDHQLSTAMFSPDGSMIVAGNGQGQVILKDASTGNLVAMLDATQGPVMAQNSSSTDSPLTIESLAFSPDKRILAAGRFDGTMFLWNAATRQLITHFRTQPQLRTIIFNADGRTLAASYDTGAILLLNSTTGQVLHRLMHPPLNSGTVSNVAFSPDGTMLASGDNKAVIFWNVATGQQVGQPLTAHSMASIKSVAFSPNGQTVAALDDGSNGSNGSNIMLWDVATMKPLLTQPLLNSDPNVTSEVPSQTGLVFSPDGTMLAAGDTQSVSIWDLTLTRPERIHTFYAPTNDSVIPYAPVTDVALSPAGQQLLIISDTSFTNYAVTLRTLNEAALLVDACSIANRNFTLGEWQQFVGSNQPYQKVCPSFSVDSSVIQNELTQAHVAVQAGDQQRAQSLYQHATQEAVPLDDDFLNNNVCAWGSTDQFAQEVLSACDRAVSLNPYNGEYYDSRAVARALLGNKQGAIDDLNFFVQWETQQNVNAPGQDPSQQAFHKHRVNERMQWIQQLRAGHNPFDSKTLQAIRVESNIDQ